MKFYLGTHRPHWLWNLTIPLFVSRRTLNRYKKLHLASAPWALDSGGFTELSIHGKWTINAATYAAELSRYEQIGNLQWAAPQDWMCEPWIIEKTGLTVNTHQQKTVENYLELKQLNAPVIPVLQGWTLQDYENCAIMYENNGIDLTTQHTVGLGSVCRRQATNEIGEIAAWAKNNRINVHGFGVKAAGLRKYGQNLTSADSLAWSYTGRFHPAPNCPKTHCGNCLHYALSWREKVVAA